MRCKASICCPRRSYRPAFRRAGPAVDACSTRRGICQRLAAHGQPPVCLSLDIDCLDPAFAPGTGTPEPGGMTSNHVLTLLEELADLPFAGMDGVEVAPPCDHAELTSMAAANFVATYLAGRISARGG